MAHPMQGLRYRVVHRSETQRYNRESVMDFMYEDEERKSLFFSARPEAGTQEMPKSWIIDIVHVAKSTPIALNRRA